MVLFFPSQSLKVLAPKGVHETPYLVVISWPLLKKGVFLPCLISMAAVSYTPQHTPFSPLVRRMGCFIISMEYEVGTDGATTLHAPTIYSTVQETIQPPFFLQNQTNQSWWDLLKKQLTAAWHFGKKTAHCESLPLVWVSSMTVKGKETWRPSMQFRQQNGATLQCAHKVLI